MTEILFKDECYVLQGCMFEVYREMEVGFLEAVYQECLEREIAAQGIPFEARQKLKILYKGEALCQSYEPDIIAYGKIIIEIKALRSLTGEHRAQALNYLKATGLQLALLVNFGHYPGVQIERLVR